MSFSTLLETMDRMLAVLVPLLRAVIPFFLAAVVGGLTAFLAGWGVYEYG